MRRLSGPLAAGAAALIGILVALAVATPASAAQLTVNSSGIMTDTATSCFDGTLDTTAQTVTSTPTPTVTLTVTEIPPACVNQKLEVWFLDSSGTLLRYGSKTITSGSTPTTVEGLSTFNLQNVDRFALFINGWPITSTLTKLTPPTTDPLAGQCAGFLHLDGSRVTGTDCSASLTSGGLQTLGIYNGGPGHFRNMSYVSSFNPAGYNSSNGWVEYQAVTKWRYTVDLTLPAISSGIDLNGDLYIYNTERMSLAPGEDCSDLTSVTFQESDQGNSPSAQFTLSDAPISWMSASSLLCSR